MTKFRFQDLRIRQLAIQIADELFDISDDLEEKKLYRFAEQLRAAGRNLISIERLDGLLQDLDRLCRQITKFQGSLR